MKTLWIMEGEGSPIDAWLAPQTEIHWLPLTSNGAAVEKWAQSARAAGLSFKILDAGRALVVETENLRLQLGKWASAMDRGTEGGVPLRERFMFPEGGVSGWWFSLLSERNPLKTDVFLRMAQLQVVERLVGSGVYGQVVHTGLKRDFRMAVHRLCQRHGVPDRAGKFKKVSSLGVREVGRRLVETLGVIGGCIAAITWLVRFWARGRLFRGHLGPLKKRTVKKGALLVCWGVSHGRSWSGEQRNSRKSIFWASAEGGSGIGDPRSVAFFVDSIPGVVFGSGGQTGQDLC